MQIVNNNIAINFNYENKDFIYGKCHYKVISSAQKQKPSPNNVMIVLIQFLKLFSMKTGKQVQEESLSIMVIKVRILKNMETLLLPKSHKRAQ